MIIGKLRDLSRYQELTQHLTTAVNYLKNNDLSKLDPGKYDIDGDNVKLIRESYSPRPINECFFEGHQKYIDLQIVLKGKEGFGYVDINHYGVDVVNAYDSVKDIAKYGVKNFSVFEMTDQTFAIVFPEDLHMPKIQLADSRYVEKAVFKIKL